MNCELWTVHYWYKYKIQIMYDVNINIVFLILNSIMFKTNLLPLIQTTTTWLCRSVLIFTKIYWYKILCICYWICFWQFIGYYRISFQLLILLSTVIDSRFLCNIFPCNMFKLLLTLIMCWMIHAEITSDCLFVIELNMTVTVLY